MTDKLVGIILAAGKGKRLKRFNKPKSLIEYKKKFLISHIIDNFKLNNIKNINVITGYKKKYIQRKINSNFIHNKKWNKTNMFYSLLTADKLLNKNYSIVSYSDIYYHSEAISDILKKKYDICITSYLGWKKLWRQRFNNPLDDLESFKIDKKNNLLEIGKQVDSIFNIKGQYMGLLGISPKGWKIIKNSIKKLSRKSLSEISLTEVLSLVLSKNNVIKTIPYKKLFFEIDFIKDLEIKKKNEL
jgi:choline kinase